MLKRAFDIVFSVGALIVLSPLLLAVALWVKLDSPGPVLFRQVRVGRGGRLFRICKFRTMRNEQLPSGSLLTIGEDPRITRSGTFLRKYKIDEFPQFYNVAVGDMSVVGPRPEVPRYVAMYPAEIKDLVLGLRPGITDMASVQYRDESSLLGRSADPERTYVEQVMPAKLALYAEYARNQSFGKDLSIVGRSLRLLFEKE